MAINCSVTPPPNTVVEPTSPPKWTAGQRSRLAELAAQRAEALSAQADLYRSVDPIAKASSVAAEKSQQYWESIVFDSGHIAFLDPRRSANFQSWLADWLPIKVGVAKAVREPLLNVKRLAEGIVRETGIYEMVGKQSAFAQQIKAVAREAGVELRPDDMRRFLEEGLTPQRLNVYGNSPAQEAALLQRYVKFEQDMLSRGFRKSQLEALLNSAAEVSAQWDNFAAALRSTGVNLGNLYNIGYFPRQLNDIGYSAAKMLEPEAVQWGGVATAKSRETWRYLPEDHALTAQLLDITPQQLQEFIASPADFAQFLTKVNPADIDLLVDAGIMAKIPALTSEVNEMLVRKYEIPGVNPELMIADPMEATRLLTEKLKANAAQSAVVKFLDSEGMKQGWAITPQMRDAQPELYRNFVKLSDHIDVAAKDLYVHPEVARGTAAVISITGSPANMNNAARAWQWYRRTFAKLTLGNPLIAPAYLGRQFLGNMISAHGHGASPTQYLASVMDMLTLANKGLDAFDNVKPFRIIDGKAMTHREVVAKTVRMFSHNIIPGLDVSGGSLIDWRELDPRYITAQFRQIAAAGAQGFPEMTAELNRVLSKKADVIFTPSLKLASLFDMAGQLAVVRGRAQMTPGVASQLGAADQIIGGWDVGGKLSTWAELTTEVKRAFPMMDDPGKLVGVLSGVLPFKAWAMLNLPVQMADMIRQPSKWYNYSRVRGLFQQAQLDSTEDGGPTRDEFQPWELDSYGFLLHRDPRTKESSVLMTGSFDPRWGSLTYLAGLGGSLDPKRDLRDDKTQRFIGGMIRETSFADLYELVSGIDTTTGMRRDDSDYALSNFAGIPMPPIAAAVLSLLPPLKSLDQMPALSGTRAIIDNRTGETIVPAVEGWLGSQGKLPPNKLVGVERFLQTIGANVRIIDGIRNAQMSEVETERLLADLNTRQSKEQVALANAVRKGEMSPDSPAYAKRLEAINRMTDGIVQLEYDRQRIALWAAQNRIPPNKALTEATRRKVALDKMPLPGSDYIRQKIEEHQKRTQ